MQNVLLALLAAMLLFTNAHSQTTRPNDLLKRLLDLPAPAPISTDNKDNSASQPERPDDFYRWRNVPPDDAPIEDLLEYWEGQRFDPSDIAYQKFASPKTAERLLEHFRQRPERLAEYLGAMPNDEQTAGTIREIYRTMTSGPNENYNSHALRNWLTHNTSDGVEVLSKQVQRIRDKDNYVASESQVALRSLAKLDWDAARTSVERLEYDASNPHSQILAYWVRYVRAKAAEDSSDTETYRRKLQQVVEDRSARWSQRDLAMDALVDGGDWDGRDDWYVSLLNDETLLEIQDNGYTGLTTMMNGAASTEDWAKRFLKLVKSENKAVRSAAARNLVNIYDDEKEIIEALLPWVDNPAWAKESRDNERGKIIEALGGHDIPEAITALITVLSNEADLRLTTAKVLVKKKDPRAAPVLRSLITEESGEIRDVLIEALVACGAMSPDEQMANVEAYAVVSSTEAGRAVLEREAREDYDDDDEDSPKAARAKKPNGIPIEVLIGRVLANSDEPDDGLALRVIEREKILRIKSPEVARRLAEFISRWKGAPIYIERLRQLRSNEADINVVLTLLAERSSIRERLPNEVGVLRSSNGITRGIGACISESVPDFLSITGTGDPEAQIAMLGCARLLRAQLPVGEIARLAASSNPLLSLAAERYLESEDSVEARRFILARDPGKARILGAFMAFVPEPWNADNNSEALRAVFASVGSVDTSVFPMPKIRKFESQLKSEIVGEQGLMAVFARLPEDDSGQQVIRVYKDRTTYTWYEDTARYWSRTVSEKEFKDLHGFILSSRVDTLPPELGSCHHGCPSSEFVMLSKDGGRRIYVSGYRAKAEIETIDAHFDAFRSKGLKLHYRLADKIKGLEVILADDKFPVHALWKNENDFRVLVADVSLGESISVDLAEKDRAENAVELDDMDEDEAAKQRTARYELQQKRRQEASGKELSWRAVQNGKLGAVVAEPNGVVLLSILGQMQPYNRLGFLRSPTAAGLGNGDIYANRYPGGIFRARGSGEAVRIRAGSYENPVVSADKNWVVVTKITDREQQMITRVNLITGKEFAVTAPSDEIVRPITYLPAHGRVLLYRSTARRIQPSHQTISETPEQESDDPPSGATTAGVPPIPGQFSLLGVATGAVRPVKGEFRPIADPRYRALQNSSTPGAAWAAIYDRRTNATTIGLYVEKSFSFIPVANFPDIKLGSSDTWVQENENKVFFVYEGHVLSAPLREP